MTMHPDMAQVLRKGRKPSIERSWSPEVVPLAGEPPGVGVELYDHHANGARVTLDLSDWEAVLAAGLGKRWSLRPAKAGKFHYVGTGRRHADNGQTVLLGRHIAGALPGELVRFKDGDPLNCRKSNLVVLKGATAKKFKLDHANAEGAS